MSKKTVTLTIFIPASPIKKQSCVEISDKIIVEIAALLETSEHQAFINVVHFKSNAEQEARNNKILIF